MVKEPELVLAARRFRGGQSSAELVMGAFRSAEVYFERLPGLAMPTAEYERAAWVPVFSTPARLAAFVAARDSRRVRDVPYVCMAGSRLLDFYIANLREPVGIVLDAMDEHMVLAPPAQPATRD